MATSVYKPLHTPMMAEQQQPTLNTVLNQTMQTKQHLLLLQILHLVQESQRRATEDNQVLNNEKRKTEVERQRYDDLQFLCNITSSEILLELRKRTRQQTELMSRLQDKKSEFDRMEQDQAENERTYQEQEEKSEFEKSTRQKRLQRFLRQLRKKTDISEDDALRNAVQENNLGLVQLLLDAGKDVEAVDGEWRRPIHYASENGNLEIVKLLARYGAKLNAQIRDTIRSTPIGLAIFNGHRDLVVWLLDNGVPVNGNNTDGYSLLHDALFYEKLDIAKILLDRGADVHTRCTRRFDYNPLHIAASKGNAEMVRLIVEKGADIEARTRNRYTPLILAAMHGDLKTTKLLIELGADTSPTDFFGFNAIQAASYFNNTQVVEFLTSVS